MPERVIPGQPLRPKADDWNFIANAAERVMGGKWTPSGSKGRRRDDNSGIVWIKNDSGGDLPCLSVVGIDGPLFDPAGGDVSLESFKAEPAFTGVIPTADDHTGKFAILIEPIPDGELGRACVSGTCIVKVDVQAEDDEYADVSDDDAMCLTSGDSGAAQILCKESGTGLKWAYVRIGNPAAAGDSVVFKLTSSSVIHGGGQYFGIEQVMGESGWEAKEGATTNEHIYNLMEMSGESTGHLDIDKDPLVLAYPYPGVGYLFRAYPADGEPWQQPTRQDDGTVKPDWNHYTFEGP